MPETEAPWTVKRLLEWTTPFFQRKGVDSPRLCAELLLAHVLKSPRIALYTNYERPLSPAELADYRNLVRRAGEQEPVAYLTGRAYFFNLELSVAPGVLIPRPDTEVLVENVIRLVRADEKLQSARILDLCTGSGCIALALAANLKSAHVFATDIDSKAISTARENAEKLKLQDRVTILEGDLYAALADPQPFDFLVANPPYIATAKIESLDKSVWDFEPRIALDGGADGLSFHRRIWTDADKNLLPGGQILLEIAFDQAEAAMQAMNEFAFLTDRKILKDHAKNDRVAAARKA